MKKLLLLLALASRGMTAFAGSVGGFGGSTEITQIANNTTLVAELGKQAQLVQAAWKDLSGFTGGQMREHWASVANIMTKMKDIASKGNALSYVLEGSEEEFLRKIKDKMPTYATASAGIRRSFRDWSRTSLDSASAALLSAGLQFKDLDNEQRLLEKLKNAASTADGTVKVVQSVSMFSAELVEQMQKLRQLQMSQIQMHAAQMNTERAEKDAGQMLVDQVFQPYQPNNNGRVGFKRIPQVSSR